MKPIRKIRNKLKEIQERLEADLEICVGCNNQFQLEEMHPYDVGTWVCKPCYRNLLEKVDF